LTSCETASDPPIVGSAIRSLLDRRIGEVSHRIGGVTPRNGGEQSPPLGGSGSGKSTLGRLLLGLETPDTGAVAMKGRCQAIFQDPSSSLNPLWSIGTIVAEPLRAMGMAKRVALAHVPALLAPVGLDAADMTKRPAAFSGGQRQRIAIARALAGPCPPRLRRSDESARRFDASASAESDRQAGARARHGGSSHRPRSWRCRTNITRLTTLQPTTSRRKAARRDARHVSATARKSSKPHRRSARCPRVRTWAVSVRRPAPSRATCDGGHPETFTMSVAEAGFRHFQ
jgi:ABC-type transport system involved in cytochrome c biogenesis ATPase subunit